MGTDQEAISTTPTLPPGTTASFDPLNESYLFMLGIDKQHTLPPSACTGCTDTAVLYVQSVTLTGSGGDQVMYATGAPGEAVYYNDGGIPDGPPNFCIPVPTHHSTWGSIKAIYR